MIHRKLSYKDRIEFRHELSTIVVVLKTALTMIEKDEEVCSELITMIDEPKKRLNKLLNLLNKENL